MAKTPNIEDVEDVEVGRCYMVPTVRVPSRTRFSVMPVIGPLHEDARIIRFPHQHWHVDIRFVSEAWLKENHHCGEVIVHKRDILFTYLHSNELAVDNGRKRLRCRRFFTTFVDPRNGDIPQWIGELERKYHNERLRNGHICPHRGISCRGVAAESDGGVVCPGHGLKWGRDGRLISRIGQEFPKDV